MRLREAMSQLARDGLGLEIVAFSHDPGVDKVVAAIKGGASNYVNFPFERTSIQRAFKLVQGGKITSPAYHFQARKGY